MNRKTPTVANPDNGNDLLSALKNKQTSMNLRDYQFAKLLGVGRSTWTLTKSGRLLISLRVISGVLNNFPELKDTVVRYQKALTNND